MKKDFLEILIPPYFLEIQVFVHSVVSRDLESLLIPVQREAECRYVAGSKGYGKGRCRL